MGACKAREPPLVLAVGTVRLQSPGFGRRQVRISYFQKKIKMEPRMPIVAGQGRFVWPEMCMRVTEAFVWQGSI